MPDLTVLGLDPVSSQGGGAEPFDRRAAEGSAESPTDESWR